MVQVSRKMPTVLNWKKYQNFIFRVMFDFILKINWNLPILSTKLTISQKLKIDFSFVSEHSATFWIKRKIFSIWEGVGSPCRLLGQGPLSFWYLSLEPNFLELLQIFTSCIVPLDFSSLANLLKNFVRLISNKLTQIFLLPSLKTFLIFSLFFQLF